MKSRIFLFMVLLFCVFPLLVAADDYQAGETSGAIWSDAEPARQYADWALRAINEGRFSEALSALERAADFANVSSDISYLLAVARSKEGAGRLLVTEALDMALDTNRWVLFNENDALMLKAQQLIAMRKYVSALDCLDRIGTAALAANTLTASGRSVSADETELRILAFRGLAVNPGITESYDSSAALVRFRSLVLSAMDRFPRDPRFLRVFFEYAHNRMSVNETAGEIQAGDQALLELALRRLPFLLEADPELAWMAAPFMHNTEDARRTLASYRAGAIPNIQNRDFYPSPSSIPAALKLGLIDDFYAVEELFSGNRGINSPVPSGIKTGADPVLEKGTIISVYNLLNSDESRGFFTQKILSFSGTIINDDDKDGYVDSSAFYSSGEIRNFLLDTNQDGIFNMQVLFSANGIPVSAEVPVSGANTSAALLWDRYPSVETAILEEETFSFRPADFQFAPVSFVSLGGSGRSAGLAYPVPSSQLFITRRTLVSFCSSITRPSAEFDGAAEQIFLENGIPWQAVEILNGEHISYLEFERGVPVIQYVDLDLDGRMETIRRFHRPGANYPWSDPNEKFDWRRLLASSESDWTGEGRYKTGEVYLQDGSVVYIWDMDGSGAMNYSEIGND